MKFAVCNKEIEVCATVLALAFGLPGIPKSRGRVVEEVQTAEIIFQGIGIDDPASDGDRLNGGRRRGILIGRYFNSVVSLYVQFLISSKCQITQFSHLILVHNRYEAKLISMPCLGCRPRRGRGLLRFRADAERRRRRRRVRRAPVEGHATRHSRHSQPVTHVSSKFLPMLSRI